MFEIQPNQANHGSNNEYLFLIFTMSEELKDTFDGYLMFDFSNFHGLMA